MDKIFYQNKKNLKKKVDINNIENKKLEKKNI